jgi:hypothetical protein
MSITPYSHQYIPRSSVELQPQNHQSAPKTKNFQWYETRSLRQFLITPIRPASPPSDEDACPICLDLWQPDTQDIIQTNCGHTMHRICLMRWITTDALPNTCPSCRYQLFLKPVLEVTAKLVSDIGGWETMPVSRLDFDSITKHVKRVITPLLDVNEIREQFGIELNSSKPFRFIRAMSQCRHRAPSLSV